MVHRFRIPDTYLLICGLLGCHRPCCYSVGGPDVQAQTDSCPEGQIWSLNRCTDVEETTCQTGYTYVADNGCVLIEEDTSACPSGYEMNGGRCQVTGQSCPAGEVWRDGSCQTRDEESCPAGQERVNGSCFQITDTVCPVGYSWSDSKNKCVDNSDDDDDDDDDSSSGTGTVPSPVVIVVNPGLTFSDDTLTVTEGGDGTYTVVLNTKPTADVTVTINDPSNTDVTIDPVTLTFTPENWDEPQTVTVTAAEDDDELHETATVTHTVSGGDYDSVTPSDLTVIVHDDDGTPGVTLSDSSLTVAEGGEVTYTAVLDAHPTADVTVTINDPSNTDVTTDPATLTFTPDNWDVPQTVTVSAKEDTDQLHETATVTHTVSGATEYDSVTAPDATVTVTDNDVPTLNAVVQESGGLAESESTTSTNVVLDVTFTRPYTIYRYGESTWHSLQGATSIKVEAFWQEDSGNANTISQNLWTDPRSAEDSVCLDIAPDAATKVYEIAQTVVLPAEPENAEPGNWELRLRVEFDGVEAGECNASDPTVPLTSVDASTWVENLEEEEDE